jgi:cadmium resistance protein CadD (predicted permease)
MGLDFGQAIGTACATFAITNVDDIFVLVAFFAESTTSRSLTPVKITIGQYVGFTVIVAVSMIGFGASLLIPAEPIGFLGLLPILLGIWWILGFVFNKDEDEGESLDEELTTADGFKSVFKVASITVMNGADNISTYIPLFAEAKAAELAIYIVVYYIMLGLWCLAAYLIMRQKYILRIAQKYARRLVPFFYVGLGIFIIVNSECYPWAIEEIDDDIASHPGKIVMGVTTAGLLAICISMMLWRKLSQRSEEVLVDDASSAADDQRGSQEGGRDTEQQGGEHSEVIRDEGKGHILSFLLILEANWQSTR